MLEDTVERMGHVLLLLLVLCLEPRGRGEGAAAGVLVHPSVAIAEHDGFGDCEGGEGEHAEENAFL